MEGRGECIGHRRKSDTSLKKSPKSDEYFISHGRRTLSVAFDTATYSFYTACPKFIGRIFEQLYTGDFLKAPAVLLKQQHIRTLKPHLTVPCHVHRTTQTSGVRRCGRSRDGRRSRWRDQVLDGCAVLGPWVWAHCSSAANVSACQDPRP